MNVLATILSRPVAMSMLALIVLALSVFFGTRLPIALSPEAEFPRISVVTYWSGASSEMMARQVTAKVEAAAVEVKGVKKVSSISRGSVSRVSVEFERGANMDFAKLELSEKLEMVWQTLPLGVSRPEFQKYTPKEFEDLQGFLVYQFFPKRQRDSTRIATLAAADLKTMLDKHLLPRLAALKGIGDITIYGAENKIIKIDVNPNELLRYGLKIEDIETALNDVNRRQTLGEVRKDTLSKAMFRLSIREELASLDALKKLKIRGSENKKSALVASINLADIAEIYYEMPEPRSRFRINGEEAVTIEIAREPSSNSILLADKIQAVIDDALSTTLTALSVTAAMDKTQELRRELSNLATDSLISLVAIAVVLLIFLGSVKLSVIVLANILFSLAVSILSMSLLGYSLNLITLAGLILVFGILTDNAIVVIDNIFKRRSEHLSYLQQITTACKEIFLPVLAATLTTVGSLLPILFLPEELRLYFQEFVISVSISVLSSFIVAFTLTPSLVYNMRVETTKTSEDNVLHRTAVFLAGMYAKVLRYTIDHPKRFILVTIWAFGVPIWILPDKIEPEKNNIVAGQEQTRDEPTALEAAYNSIFGSDLFLSVKPYLNYIFGGSGYLFYRYVSRSEFFGFGNETSLGIAIELPQGADMDYLNAMAGRFEDQLRRYLDADSLTAAGIKKFVTRLEENQGSIRVFFAEKSAPNLPYLVKADMTAIGARIGGAKIGVYGYGPGFYSGGNEISSFRVKALGYNYEKLKDICAAFKEELQKNPRVDNCRIDKAFGFYESGTEIALLFDSKPTSKYGVEAASLINQFQNYTSGATSRTLLTIDGKEEYAQIKFSGGNQFSTRDIEELTLESGANQKRPVRAAEVMRVAKRSVMSEILRENQQYQRWITFDYKGRYDFGQRFLERTANTFMLPAGYTMNIKSQYFFSFSDEKTSDLMGLAIFSVVIIFMITAALYESFTKPLLILIAIPLSLIGVFLSFYFFDANFGRGGYASLILLSGIVVNNSIVLIDFIVLRQNASVVLSVADLKEMIIHATIDRARPILMTTILTIASLLPLLIRSQQSSIWYGLTIGAIGGLIASAILLLLILPAIYLMSEKRKLEQVKTV